MLHEPPRPVPSSPMEQHIEDTECAIQTLYEGEPRCICCKNWVATPPAHLRPVPEADSEDIINQTALVVRMSKNHNDDAVVRPLTLHSIVVQSRALKQTLTEVFAGYQGITTAAMQQQQQQPKLVFRAPFHAFIYRWGAFTAILERQRHDDPFAAGFTQLLYEILDGELGDLRAEMHSLLAQRVITYSLLWALFEPGTNVVARDDEHEDTFCRVDSPDYYGPKEQAYFQIAARSVDWNGTRFGYRHRKFRVDRFSGTREIRGLPVYPVVFHPAQEEAEGKAIARGRRFRELAGRHYMAYSGVIQYGNASSQFQRYMDGRIVVDADGYLHANPTKSVPLEPLDAELTAPRIAVADDKHVERPLNPSAFLTLAPQGCFMTPECYDGSKGFSARLGHVAGPEADQDKDLTEADLLICEPRVLGYSLQHKVWATFNVPDITPIVWNDTAFSTLMLPPSYKDLVLSFVEGQAAHRDVFDDVIEGKGQGIIMLLVGNPGTGKTLTAEAIADQVRKPLYALSAGELGQQAEGVERRLSTVLELTERWDTVLLFDECDVFLQERSGSQMQHNEVVAVFLRWLEYYRGIMIMTSNRADAIDRAFQSRIHLTLHYPDLDGAAREQIWRRCLTRSKCQHALTDEEVRRLALVTINGRQIKNTVRVAALLAAQGKTCLGMEQINIVLQATRMIAA